MERGRKKWRKGGRREGKKKGKENELNEEYSFLKKYVDSFSNNLLMEKVT